MGVHKKKWNKDRVRKHYNTSLNIKIKKNAREVDFSGVFEFLG